MQNISKISYVTITPANVNGVWLYRLYVNQQPIGDYADIKLAIEKLYSMVKEIENEQMFDFAYDYCEAILGGCNLSPKDYFHTTYEKTNDKRDD